jgi:hypothetical protein
MVNKGFPNFGTSKSGSFVAILKNYNLPDFVLTLVAKECKSPLQERGRLDDKLKNMSDSALELLHKVFVGCEEDDAGKYAQYRFFAYVSSMYHKCEVIVNDTIPGVSDKDHKVLVAVKDNGMYISLAHNKAIGNPVNKKEISKFYEMVDDVKKGDHGTMLTDAVYGSSVGFRKEALEELAALSKSRDNDPENKLDFKVANFENNIYSVIN